MPNLIDSSWASDMGRWDSALIGRIFAAKEREKSEDRDNLLLLTSKRLYGEKIHYVLELIQNAEDEASETIAFIFDKHSAAVINDGRPFDEEDVWGICSVRPGRKKNKIGFFGIGFKSVFSVTERPRVISGKFNFELESYIYPTPKDDLPKELEKYYRPDKGAIFVLPFSEGMPTPTELTADFSLIDSKILLFLENLRKLEFHDNIRGIHWEIERKVGEDSAVLLFDGRQEEEVKETRWRVFHRDVLVGEKGIIPEGKEGIAETRLTIAIPIDSATRDSIKKRGVIYCYLPTRRRSDLHFLIQADFLPTIGRENISDHPWNVWLMRELGKMAGDVIDEMKNDRQLGAFVYDYIPLEDESQDELVKVFYSELAQNLKDKDIARTTYGWAKPAKCVIPNNDDLRTILSEPDLKALLHQQVYYLDQNLSVSDEYTRAEHVLFELGAKEVGERQVVDFVKLEAPLARKPSEWYLNLYAYLSDVFDTTNKSYAGDFTWNWDEETKDLFHELKSARFILTDNKSRVPLDDATKPDRLICYPQTIDLSEVYQLFTEGEIVFLHPYFQESTIIHRRLVDAHEEEKRSRVKDWFDDIGVRKYFKQAHIIREVILPKFAVEKYRSYDDRKLYEFVNYIRNYWPTIESEISSKKLSANVVDEIKDTIRLKAYSYKGKEKVNEYRKPSEIYFSKRYGKNEMMELLFHGTEGHYFLSPYYLNREKTEVKKKRRGRQKAEYSWRKFFEILGVWSSPRVMKKKERTRIYWGEYEWVERVNSTRGHEIYSDSYSDDIKQIIEHSSEVVDSRQNLRRLTLLWDSLAKNWKSYVERGFCRTRYYWFYMTEKYTDIETSSFLEYLRNARWVPGNDGGFYRPSELLVDTKQNRLLLGDSVRYLAVKGPDPFLRDLKLNSEPQLEQVIEELTAYRKRNPNPRGNQVRKMEAIYRFIDYKLRPTKDAVESGNSIQQIRDKFEENELLYLPRADKAWWKPSKVFWRDFSNRFGLMRGYIEHRSQSIYDHGIFDFFALLGIKDRPSVEDSLDILEELKLAGNFDEYRRFASKIYPYIESIVSEGNLERANLDRPVFISMNDTFRTPSQLYYSDDDELCDHFKSDIEILWLPCSWVNLENMLTVAGFNCLSDSISIAKRFDQLTEVDGESAGELKRRLQYAMLYLKKKGIELYEELEKRDIRQQISQLEVYETSSISLDYILTIDNSNRAVVKDVPKLAYLSLEEKRLYKSDTISLYSVHVAKELSKLFITAENDLFPFLDSIFSVTDEDELKEKLKHFGIYSVEATVDKPVGEVEITPSEGDAEREEEEPETKREGLAKGEPPPRPQPPGPAPPARKPDLINPDEFMFHEIEEFTPYVGSDGKKNVPARTVELREARPGSGKPRRQPRMKPNRGDAEEIALDLVMSFEEMEGRYPDDRHKQSGIGYDVYSITDTGEERFIEVKHFRGESGLWELTPHQWKKAEEESDRYYVYVVSGLRDGNTPAIELIQNPTKYLIPDPPVQKKFSSWRNGVSRVVKCQKI